MIKFALGCEKEHEFEGWFGSSEEFVRLQKQGLLDCPVCGSGKIEKLLMAPAIPTKSNVSSNSKPSDLRDRELPVNEMTESESNSEQIAVPSPNEQNLPSAAVAVSQLPAQIADAHEAMVEKIREFKKHVVANTEDVGENFVEEARKIHFGEAEERGIHGKANFEEAVELAEEGIEVMPIPELPEEKN